MAQVQTELKTNNVETESLWFLAWKRFKKNKLAVAGAIIVIIIGLSALFAPLLATHNPHDTKILEAKQPPSAQHWLGTDRVGRDIYSRLLYGGRVSFTVGIVSMSISIIIGTITGLLAGYYGGWLDTIITRLVDIFTSMPFLVLAITVAAIWGPGLYKIMAIIGFLSWPSVTRLVRGEVLSLRSREFIMASHSVGANDLRIMLKHLLPNSMAPIVVSATLRVAGAILSEAALSFLGLGIQPPRASWGSMLQQARSISMLEDMPWFWIPPGILIVLTVISINFMGDGLRDALDPKLK